MEVRISGVAVSTEQCGLDREKIYKWLETIGTKFAKETNSFEIVLIKASDVVDGKLVTEWKNLNRIHE